jgi:hypothetical protein
LKATFVATFADGETVRMSTYCKNSLDWGRGRRLAAHAWQTRSRQKSLVELSTPEITAYHFEVDGAVFRELEGLTA